MVNSFQDLEDSSNRVFIIIIISFSLFNSSLSSPVPSLASSLQH